MLSPLLQRLHLFGQVLALAHGNYCRFGSSVNKDSDLQNFDSVRQHILPVMPSHSQEHEMM